MKHLHVVLLWGPQNFIPQFPPPPRLQIASRMATSNPHFTLGERISSPVILKKKKNNSEENIW